MKKTNNKGFSLVELIIVIAIMAILIGVLAPQYIKYVEKSRKSADSSLVDSCASAVQVALTDDDYDLTTVTGTVTNLNLVIISKANGVQLVSDAGLQAAFTDYFGANYASKKFKSKTFGTSSVTIDVTGTPEAGYKIAINGLPASVE